MDKRRFFAGFAKNLLYYLHLLNIIHNGELVELAAWEYMTCIHLFKTKRIITQLCRAYMNVTSHEYENITFIFKIRWILHSSIHELLVHLLFNVQKALALAFVSLVNWYVKQNGWFSLWISQAIFLLNNISLPQLVRKCQY